MTDMTVTLSILMIIAGIFLAGALTLAFMPRGGVCAPVAALVSLWCALLGAGGWSMWPILLFWSVATALVLGIYRLSADQPRPGRTAGAYVTGGALAGAVVGMIMTTSAAVIIGAVAGAFCGAFAFSRTPGGRQIAFTALLLRCGLPAVVVMSMAATALGAMLMEASL